MLGEPLKTMQDKADVNYRPGDELQSCKTCAAFSPPQSCTKVQGEISKDGLCDLFEEATDVAQVNDFLFGGSDG